jgi:hypothetical protein
MGAEGEDWLDRLVDGDQPFSPTHVVVLVDVVVVVDVDLIVDENVEVDVRRNGSRHR